MGAVSVEHQVQSDPNSQVIGWLIFTYSSDKGRSDKLCSKQLKLAKKTDIEYTSCHQVDINFHSFLPPTWGVCLMPSAVNTNNIEDDTECDQVDLVKSSELGMEIVSRYPPSPAPAQVNYNSNIGGHVSFMLKGGKVFGTLEAEKGNYYNLEPCVGIKDCHLWIQIKKKRKQ